VYRLEAAPLAELAAWFTQFRTPWDGALDALETEVHRTRRQRRTEPTTNTSQGRTA